MSVEHAGNGAGLAVGPGVAEEGPLPSPRAADTAKRRGGGVACGSAEGCAARRKIDLVQRDIPPRYGEPRSIYLHLSRARFEEAAGPERDVG